ncbi:hypothetical protein CPAR01_12194 [Colletotrichum paranaense]|uniref:Clr5 domain-containing protein n=1 Tax=Colletotrichum paranaense TaxID=1914294 RepID=A0ABQ9S9L3_9PEZI|nr:uncharacterized protein CPAR01_12194 [Colletotrichum paranaense]KAK1529882.1 hypothetical protein CPAR01_12194 [Colletotrichum paranaense]
MSRPQRQAVISEAKWERVKPSIRRLYLQEDMALSFVLTALETLHNLHASKAQLEWKLKQWGMVKNMSALQWKCVDFRIRERLSRGKKTSLYLSGIPLRPAAVEKARARHCHTSLVERLNPSLTINIPMQTTEFPSATILVGRELGRITSRRTQLLDNTPTLQQTFHTLYLLMPERTTDNHAFRATSLIQSSPSECASPDALEAMFFLLSNGFCNYLDEGLYDRDMINEAILTIFRNIPTWRLFVSRQSNSLPISLQALLCQIFEKAVLASDLATIESLALAGTDVNLPLYALPIPTSMRAHDCCLRAIHWAVYTLNIAMVELLTKFGARSHSVDLEMLRIVWMGTLRPARVVRESPLGTMTRWVLSFYRYQEDDEIASRVLLNELGSRAHSSATELVLEFFESKFKSATSFAQLLITAVKTSSEFVFEWATKHRGCLNYMNFMGESVLGVAASRNNYSLCEHLLELGALPNPVTKFGSSVFTTPLQCAAASADSRLIKLLLDHGADVNFCQPFAGDYAGGPRCYRRRHVTISRGYSQVLLVGQLGRTALQAALSCGSEENALFLLSRGAKLLGEELVISIRTRLVSATRQILARGLSYNAPSLSDELSPLEAAILVRNSRLALEITASLDTNKFSTRTVYAAVYMALYTFNRTLLHKLLELSKIAHISASEEHWLGTAMCLAMRLGIDDVADQILETGLCPHHLTYASLRCDSIIFALHYKPYEISKPVQRYEEQYLEAIDDTERHYLEKQPATFYALLSSPQCVTMLLRHGHRFNTDCSVVSENSHALAILPLLQGSGAMLDRVLLTRAILAKSTAVIDWYFASGIGISTVHWPESDRFYGTPLRAAATTGNINLLEALVAMGADVNEYHRDFHCYPPLTEAAMRGFFGAVKRLLDLDADPNIPGGTIYTRTALEGASEYGRLDIVQLLLDSGVSTEGNGRLQYVRAVVLARRRGRPAVERLLRNFRRWDRADQELFDEAYNHRDHFFEGLVRIARDSSEIDGYQYSPRFYDVEADLIMTPASGTGWEPAKPDDLTLPSEIEKSIQDSKADNTEMLSGGGTLDLQGIPGTGYSDVNGALCRADICSLHDDQCREGNSDDWLEKYIRFPSETPSFH